MEARGAARGLYRGSASMALRKARSVAERRESVRSGALRARAQSHNRTDAERAAEKGSRAGETMRTAHTAGCFVAAI